MYIGPKLRTERPRKTKIGTEVAHVTRDSDTTFKVKVTRLLWLPVKFTTVLDLGPMYATDRCQTSDRQHRLGLGVF